MGPTWLHLGVQGKQLNMQQACKLLLLVRRKARPNPRVAASGRQYTWMRKVQVQLQLVQLQQLVQGPPGELK